MCWLVSKIHEAEEEMEHPLVQQKKKKHHREVRKENVSKVSKNCFIEL